MYTVPNAGDLIHSGDARVTIFKVITVSCGCITGTVVQAEPIHLTASSCFPMLLISDNMIPNLKGPFYKIDMTNAKTSKGAIIIVTNDDTATYIDHVGDIFSVVVSKEWREFATAALENPGIIKVILDYHKEGLYNKIDGFVVTKSVKVLPAVCPD